MPWVEGSWSVACVEFGNSLPKEQARARVQQAQAFFSIRSYNRSVAKDHSCERNMLELGGPKADRWQPWSQIPEWPQLLTDL